MHDYLWLACLDSLSMLLLLFFTNGRYLPPRLLFMHLTQHRRAQFNELAN